MQSKEPNPGHLAIAQCEARLRDQGRRVVVITQNIDELHRKAGTKNLLEIHGEENIACPPYSTRRLSFPQILWHFPQGHSGAQEHLNRW